MTDRSPAADLLDRARSLAARYDGPPVPATLMAVTHRRDPTNELLFAFDEPHWPGRFHPAASGSGLGWEKAGHDAPPV